MCGVCGDAEPDFFRQENRRARKKHWCSECRKVILKGDHYLYIVQKSNDSGEILSDRLCRCCENDWNELEQLVDSSDHPPRLAGPPNEVPEHLGDFAGAVEVALEMGIITRHHALVRRWLPDQAAH